MLKYSLILILFFTNILLSQNWEKVDSVFAPSGVTVQRFSAPAFGDIDSDGDFDLVLGSIELEIEYFENTGNNLHPEFKKDTSMFSSIYAGGYQFTNADYPALADLDDDNDLDLIIGGFKGLLYYENKGDSFNPFWVKVDSIFASVNTEIGSDPRPAFADLDNDGDIDLLVGIGESLLGGPTAGITIGFRNNGSSKAPMFERDNSLAAGIPDVGLNAYPALDDLDNDGDYDLLMGRDGAQVYYYKNTGSVNSPTWTRDFSLFSGVETTNYWKDPFFCDLDGDGDPDLIYGTDDGHLYFYENTGTISNPSYLYNPSYFKVIKADGWSTVSLADYDSDNDLDLLSGSTLGKLFYAKNEGSSANPLFTTAAAGFTNLSPGFRAYPVFVDIDNDNDFDIVSGYSSGKLILYINNNNSFNSNNTMFSNISVTYGSIPAFADIDGDKDFDLLVGSDDPNTTKFYLNNGDNTFTEDNTLFAGVNFPRGSSPTFVDINNDEDFDLFIGRSTGSIEFYENTGDKNNPVWQINNSLLAGIKVKQNAHPGFADLNNDGRKDLIIGEYDGNFTFYKNLFAPVSADEKNPDIPSEFLLEQNYPNPFNPGTKIKYTIQNAGSPLPGGVRGGLITLKVYDILGNEVALLVNQYQSPGEYEIEFNASNLSSGIYIYKLTAGDFISSKKMILMK